MVSASKCCYNAVQILKKSRKVVEKGIAICMNIGNSWKTIRLMPRIFEQAEMVKRLEELEQQEIRNCKLDSLFGTDASIDREEPLPPLPHPQKQQMMSLHPLPSLQKEEEAGIYVADIVELPTKKIKPSVLTTTGFANMPSTAEASVSSKAELSTG
ncbi:unnamed protein product [Cylicostephanus goldi]|uniref:Uncharacterized protein n=1 Tax=Cylicostephanus goldi TaxID=71465 RepID=A0A3P7N526_CYLGO|nr:unnamed protein product [Cylicostephanus goldi]